MSKVFDITDKLNLEERPRIAIRGEEFTINNDVETVFAALETLSGTMDERTKTERMTDLLFGISGGDRLRAMGLSYDDYTTVLSCAVGIALRGDPDTENTAGEAKTPAMT